MSKMIQNKSLFCAQAQSNMSAAQRGTCYGTVPSNCAEDEGTHRPYIHISDDYLAENINSPYNIV